MAYFLSIFVNIPDISRNSKKIKIFLNLILNVPHKLSDFKNFPKKLIYHSPKIVIFTNNEILLWLEFLIILKRWNCYKSVFVMKTWQRHEFMKCMKIQTGALLWNLFFYINSLLPTVLTKLNCQQILFQSDKINIFM